LSLLWSYTAYISCLTHGHPPFDPTGCLLPDQLVLRHWLKSAVPDFTSTIDPPPINDRTMERLIAFSCEDLPRVTSVGGCVTLDHTTFSAAACVHCKVAQTTRRRPPTPLLHNPPKHPSSTHPPLPTQSSLCSSFHTISHKPHSSRWLRKTPKSLGKSTATPPPSAALPRLTIKQRLRLSDPSRPILLGQAQPAGSEVRQRRSRHQTVCRPQGLAARTR
jgi:hypothetical protein